MGNIGALQALEIESGPPADVRAKKPGNFKPGNFKNDIRCPHDHRVDPDAGADNTLLSALLDCQDDLLELVSKHASLHEIVARITGITEELLHPARCSILLADWGESAAPRNAPCRIAQDLVHITSQLSSPAASSDEAGEPFAQRRTIVADVLKSSPSEELRSAAHHAGIRACWFQPILSREGLRLGTFALFYEKPYRPSALDLRAVNSLSALLGFAVKNEKRERARRFANERFTSLASSIPGVVYQRRVTPDGEIRYTYISEGAKTLFGVSPEEILADPNALFDCHGPEYREDFRERLLKASREMTLWDVEAQIVTRDGEEKWTHAIARPHRQPDGSVLWDGVILDATRFKKAQVELRQAKEAAETANRAQADLLDRLNLADERFRSLARTIPGVVYQRRVTPDGDIHYTYISEGAKSLFGVSPEEILADPQALFDCHGPEYRADFRERLLKASRDLTLWDVEAQIISRDGKEKWTHAIACPHHQPDGSVLWNGVILDATRIKKTERELRQAMEAAEAASRAKTQFLARMSHELRTPLNAIIGFSDLLKSQLPDSQYGEYANDINDSGVSLLKAINEILEFTKLETGEFDLLEQEISVASLVDRAATQMGPFAKAAKVELRKSLNENLPLVLGDFDKIKKILTILLSNAIKFTPSGGKVRIIVQTGARGELELSVVDTGIGVAQEERATVFEAFGQVDGDLNRRYEGTGLGLALAKSLAKIHDASLTFKSEVDQGTAVTLAIPSNRLLHLDFDLPMELDVS